MNWITDFVRPRINALINKNKEIPDDLWFKCPKCEQMIFHKELKDNLKVCPNCAYHIRLTTKERLDLIFDNAEYQLLPMPRVLEDPLGFKDHKRYVDRLKDARSKTKQEDAISFAKGSIEGQGVIVGVMSFDFLGGSMGLFVGKAFYSASEFAIKNRLPFIIFTASGGARMYEGILALMQMPVTVIAVDAINEAKLPYIVVMTDPTMGGVSASFAMLGDIAIAESGALIGFAGPKVIEETIKQKLPEGFQKAEFLKEHGMLDIVVPRKEVKNKISKMLQCLVKG